MTDELDEQRAAEIRLERAVADTLSADGWAENWEHAVTCARAVIPVAQAPKDARIAELEKALRQYGWHNASCRWSKWEGQRDWNERGIECTCGFSNALRSTQ